jgi:DNA-binding transcriptional MerR regulator
MDIGQVAKISKMPVSTLRFYEEKGLIKSIGRHGLRRYFAEDVVETLGLITLGRNAGLSLDEIGKMLLPQGVEVDRELLLLKADELDRKILEMTAIRDGLRHASACQAETHMECPKFRRLINIAGKKWGRPKHKL